MINKMSPAWLYILLLFMSQTVTYNSCFHCKLWEEFHSAQRNKIVLTFMYERKSIISQTEPLKMNMSARDLCGSFVSPVIFSDDRGALRSGALRSEVRSGAVGEAAMRDEVWTSSPRLGSLWTARIRSIDLLRSYAKEMAWIKRRWWTKWRHHYLRYVLLDSALFLQRANKKDGYCRLDFLIYVCR